MHPQAHAFVAAALAGRSFTAAVEVGGRDINGGVRDLIEAAAYTCVDLLPGAGVDVVADCRTWRPATPADLVVCCEVLEHTPQPEQIVAACADYLAPGGLMVLTCAGPGRNPHSGVDGGTLRPGEYYDPVGAGDLTRWLEAAGLVGWRVTFDPRVCDTYATAHAPARAAAHTHGARS